MKGKRLTVEQLMTTALICLKETDTVGHAQLDMQVAAIRHLPIVDDRNHLVGILSNRDLIRAMAEGMKDQPIGQVMTRAVKAVRASTPAYEAAETMLDGKFGSLPVIGDEEQLVGIVTETDFLQIAARALRDAKDGATLLAS